MLRLRSTRLRAVVGAAALAAAFTATPAYAGTASMGGTVTDAETGQPVAGVCVLLWRDYDDSAWEQYPESCTGDDGAWSYTDLEPGRYYVEAKGAGYVKQFAYGQDDSWSATRFEIAEGDSPVVDLAMVAGGTISGTVTDAATGEPAYGVCVSTQGEMTWMHTCTDEAGHYEMSGLRAGEYGLYFADHDYGRYQPEFAHDTTDYEAMARFTVTAGETTVVDEDMTAAASIVGRVTDEATGEGLPNVCVQAMTEPESFDSHGHACTDETGAYRLSPVEPGTYHVVVDDYTGAHPRVWYPGATHPSGSETVTLGVGQAVDAVDVAMPAAAYVTGTVTDAAGQALAGVCVGAQRVDGGWVRNAGEPANCSDDTGQYRLGGLPGGDVKLLFNPTSSDHLQQWAYGAATADEAQVFSIVAGETTTGVDVTMQEGGRINGRITDARTKKPVEGACVTVGVYSHRAGENGTQWPGVCTGADGRYELRGLPTGSYTVEFYDPEGVWAWQFFPGKADRIQAAKLQVTAGTTLSGINAKLSPGGTLEGLVIDGATGEPADDVCMDATTAREAVPFGTGWCTGPDGRYTLRGFPTTKVKVQFFGNGYVPEWAFDKDSHETATPIATVGGATVTVPTVVLGKYAQ